MTTEIEPSARWIDYPGAFRVERHWQKWRVVEVNGKRGPRWKVFDSFEQADADAKEKSRKWQQRQRARQMEIGE